MSTPWEVATGRLEPAVSGAPAWDPFVEQDALLDAYFFGIVFDVVDGTVALLFGELDLEAAGGDTVGLLVFRGVAEVGWKAREWDISPAPGWWTVLGDGIVGPTEGARVEIPPLAGWQPEYSTGSEVFIRYGLALNPPAQAIVVFQSASYYTGVQVLADEEERRYTFDGETEWHTACHWPR